MTASLLPGPDAAAQSNSNEETISQLQRLRETADSLPDPAAQLQALEKSVAADAPYPVRRELMRTRLALLGKNVSQDQRLALMKALRDLAQSNGDANTIDLMDIERIFMIHADDSIDIFIAQLNEVRARLSPDASVEVMQALESAYGNLYFDAGNFDTSLRHQLAALDLADRLTSGRDRARLYRIGIIAELYNAMGLPHRALELVERVFKHEASTTILVDNRISLLSARSMALMQLGRMTESEAALDEAETLSRERKSDFTAMRVGALRSELLLATSRPEQTIEVVDRLSAVARRTQNAYYIAKGETLRGEALMQMGKIEEGLALMQQGIDYFKSKGQMVDLLASLDDQIAALREKKLYARAVALMDQRSDLWSQLFRNERGRAIAEVEARHTAETFERRITTLSAENRAQKESLRAERLSKALAATIAIFGVTLSAALFFAIRRTRRQRDSLSTAVRFDALTAAYSRYQFQHRDGSAGVSPVGLLLLDLDNFKATNDQYGHEAGDEVLKRVVERIRDVIGTDDEIYRWGGEEFLIVLNSGSAATRVDLVIQMQSSIECSPVTWHGQSLPVSVSGGFIQHPMANAGQGALVDAIGWVDAALYVAKNRGRGRIEQVTLTAAGAGKLEGQRPIDMEQLLDWQRQGYVVVETMAASHSQG